MSFFCFLEVNMGCGANSLSVRMLHLLRKPGHFDKMLPCPHEDEQGQHLSSASIKFLWLRQIHDPSGISPALDNALSTLLSCCSQHFFLVRVLASFIHLLGRWSRSVTTTVNKSQRRQAFACRLL